MGALSAGSIARRLGRARAAGAAGTGLASCRDFPGADDFDLYPAVGLQALDELLVLAGFGSHPAAAVPGHGLALAFALGADLVARNSGGSEILLHRCGAPLGKSLVVLFRGDPVGMAYGIDLVHLGALDARSEAVELAFAFFLQRGLVEIEQHVGGEGELFDYRACRRRRSRGSGRDGR